MAINVNAATMKWEPVVISELKRANCPLPSDLILAVIYVESRGKAGLVNPNSGASGLMQVMSGTLADYNKNHPNETVTLDELRSKTSLAAAVKQIRVGLWVVRAYWKSAYKFLSKYFTTVPVDELAHFADLFYVAGPGATRKRAETLSPPTWASIQNAFPKWNALPHPRNVFGALPGLQWPVDAISQWLESKSLLKPLSPREGVGLALVGLCVIWWWWSKKGKPP